jgi:hypothetical protein
VLSTIVWDDFIAVIHVIIINQVLFCVHELVDNWTTMFVWYVAS